MDFTLLEDIQIKTIEQLQHFRFMKTGIASIQNAYLDVTAFFQFTFEILAARA